jgi:hypothetical protein
MKGFYRKLLPLLVGIVILCLILNYSINGANEAAVSHSAPTTAITQPKEERLYSPTAQEKEVIQSPGVIPPPKKKIAYAITITKDGKSITGITHPPCQSIILPHVTSTQHSDLFDSTLLDSIQYM